MHATSPAILPDGGGRNTLGPVPPGRFRFGTDVAERMETVAGRCRVTRDASTETREHGPGVRFEVLATSSHGISR